MFHKYKGMLESIFCANEHKYFVCDYGLSKTFNQTYKICLFLCDAVCKFIALFQFLILEGSKNTHRNICLDVYTGSFLVMT